MEHIIFGILSIIVAITLYIISWRIFKQNKVLTSILFVLLAGLILRIYLSLDFQLHEWDERYHALVAKNMIESPLKPMLYKIPVLPYDYKDWTKNHVWLHKPPFPLWSMSLSMWIFGKNEIALRLPSIILSALSIWLIFLLSMHLYNRFVAFFSALFLSINGLIIELASGWVTTDHIDIFFMFFILLSVYFTVKYIKTEKYYFNLLIGLSIGIAILCKWLPALIVFPVYFFLCFDSKKFSIALLMRNMIIMGFIAMLTFLPWQLFIFSSFPVEAKWEFGLFREHITRVIDNHGNPFYYYLNILRISHGEFIYIPCLWFIYKAFRKRKIDYKKVGIIIWFVIPYLFFSFVKTKMQAYTLFASPAIFIITALFCVYLFRFREKFRFRIFAYFLLAALILLPVRYTIERLKIFEKRERHHEWVKHIKEIKKSPDKELVVFNSKHPIETMFYKNCTAYSIIPDSATIENIKSAGYEVLILTD